MSAVTRQHARGRASAYIGRHGIWVWPAAAGVCLLIATVTASPSADLHALHQRIETVAFARARRALGRTSQRIQLDLGVSRRTG